MGKIIPKTLDSNFIDIGPVESVYYHGPKIVPLSWDDALEISLKSIAEIEDPYYAFVDSIENSETLRKYDRRLEDFLNLVSFSIYEKHLSELPTDNNKYTFCKFLPCIIGNFLEY